MKKCCYCGEEIQNIAEKCIFCNESQPIKRKLRDQLLRNWNKQSSTDILLWAGILLIAPVITFLISQSIWQNILFSLIATSFVVIVILFGRLFCNMQPTAFLAIFTIYIAIANLYQQNVSLKTQIGQLGQQNTSLKTQIDQFQIDKRPYLFVDFSHIFKLRDKDMLFGAKMLFRNKGQYPASDVEPKYLVCDDKGRSYNFEKWYGDSFGGFPKIQVVPPDSSIDIVYCPGIEKDATFASIGILVNYQGLDSGNKHWFKRQDVFKIEKDENGNAKEVKLIKYDIFWDKNKTGEGPDLIQPDWNMYRKKQR